MEKKIREEIEKLQKQNEVENSSYQSMQEKAGQMQKNMNNLALQIMQRSAQIAKLEELLVPEPEVEEVVKEEKGKK